MDIKLVFIYSPTLKNGATVICPNDWLLNIANVEFTVDNAYGPCYLLTYENQSYKIVSNEQYNFASDKENLLVGGYYYTGVEKKPFLKGLV